MMAAVKVLLLGLALTACSSRVGKETLKTETLTSGLWVHLDSEWIPSQASSGFDSSAYARVARFGADGNFSWIACMLLRNERNHTVAISAGDGQVYFFGYWRESDAHVFAEFIKAREMIHIPGTDLPFEKKRTSTVRVEGDRLVFDGLEFGRDFAPDVRAYEEMVTGVREWEADRLRPIFQR